MSRPQIGIDRLPTRRVPNEPRESMNCKSCRKRKVNPTTKASRTHRRKLMLFKDQVQSPTSNVRSLPGLRMSVHLWYANPPRAPDSLPSRAFGNFQPLTSHHRCYPQEEGPENRRARSSLEACRWTRETSALGGEKRCAARRRVTY